MIILSSSGGQQNEIFGGVYNSDMLTQTGEYVVRAEDLPRASKLPCAQRPIKRAEFEKYTKPFHMGRRCEDGFFMRANLMAKTIFRAQKTNFQV